MKTIYRCLLICGILCCGSVQADDSTTTAESITGTIQQTGHLGDAGLTECSGIDVSTATGTFLWAINDSGNRPHLFAIGFDGRSLGRVKIKGVRNRDWESIATFRQRGVPMILVADVGDNRQRHASHTLYLLREPTKPGDKFGTSATVSIDRRIVFAYPDGGHDAEAVAVDPAAGLVLVLTKRDAQPLLFTIPLDPPATEGPVLARQIATLEHLPPPTTEDLHHKYGKYGSQPTAMDISDDGLMAVVLTYKHAYLFQRQVDEHWDIAFTRLPRKITLPAPDARIDFAQRESICFAPDNMSVYTTAEGAGAGIFRIPVNGLQTVHPI